MPSYRLCVHAKDERLIGELLRDAPNDADAVRLAEAALTRDETIMVWHGERFLQRVTRPGNASPAPLWE